MNNIMTKEMELILNVTKIKKTEKENDKVNKLLLDTELDWIKIVGTLFFHRIAGYFYYGLSEMQLKKIIIVSNKKCEHAIHLYRKFGFEEVPVDKEKFPFDRADIAFELYLND